MDSKPIIVGGVPEHFNLPWHMGIERGIFAKHGVIVEWSEQSCGTGAMIKALKDGEVDVIVALTEGLVSEIVKGSPLSLIGTYVQSSLCWAVITGGKSNIQDVEGLKNKKFGISRMTSGSHLMVCVMAMERGWHPQNDVSFSVQGNFQSLRNSVNEGSSSAFLWEYFTSKPYRDSGEVRFVGEITTPWPCFMMCARTQYVEENRAKLSSLLRGINEAANLFHETPNMHQVVAQRYNLNEDDALSWYNKVRITATPEIPESALKRVVDTLYQAKILDSPNVDLLSLVDKESVEVVRDIRAMKLYAKPELLKAMRNNLIAVGKASGPLSFRDLYPYDQHHYHGIDALKQCADALKISKGSRVLNFGSGLGGPARYFAGEKHCKVLAVELQEDLHRAARELTQRCNLGDNSENGCVVHMSGDIVQILDHLKQNSYDHMCSWLTVLHLPPRELFFAKCFNCLAPGGYFYAEDLFKLHQFTDAERETLMNEVYCPYLPDLVTYRTHLSRAGFEVIEMTELTDDWREYTAERVIYFENQKNDLLRIHREDTYNRLKFFYTTISDLFKGGNLGGVRVIARKPLS